MAFVKGTPKVTGNDPRTFVAPGLPAPAQISLDSAGKCKGFQIGGGRFVSLKVPASCFGILRDETVKAAEKASEAVDAAMAAKKYTAEDKGEYTVWTYKG